MHTDRQLRRILFLIQSLFHAYSNLTECTTSTGRSSDADLRAGAAAAALRERERMMPSKRIHFEDGVGSSEEGEEKEAEEEEEEEPEFLSTEEASDLHFGGMHV